jgi:hypothetical protein
MNQDGAQSWNTRKRPDNCYTPVPSTASPVEGPPGFSCRFELITEIISSSTAWGRPNIADFFALISARYEVKCEDYK